MIKERPRKKEIGTEIKQDIFVNRANNYAYLAIGSNLGKKKNNIEKSKYLLQINGVLVDKVSSDYESLSWPDNRNPKFINIVIKVRTHLNAYNLLQLCNKIEKLIGRRRNVKNEPRTCDIDIIDYNGLVTKRTNKNKLILPHPKVSRRNFVLLPLFEVSSHWTHPKTKINIKKLISSLNIKDLRTIKQI